EPGGERGEHANHGRCLPVLVRTSRASMNFYGVLTETLRTGRLLGRPFGERIHLAFREREVARGDVMWAFRLERRLDLPADLLGLPAPGVEAACGRRRDRARDGALEHDAAAAAVG